MNSVISPRWSAWLTLQQQQRLSSDWIQTGDIRECFILHTQSLERMIQQFSYLRDEILRTSTRCIPPPPPLLLPSVAPSHSFLLALLALSLTLLTLSLDLLTLSLTHHTLSLASCSFTYSSYSFTCSSCSLTYSSYSFTRASYSFTGSSLLLSVCLLFCCTFPQFSARR